MTGKFTLALVGASLFSILGSASAACPPKGFSRAQLIALRDGGFALPSAVTPGSPQGGFGTRPAKTSGAGIAAEPDPKTAAKDAEKPKPTSDEMALDLLDCLAHADPVLRDEIAFSALNQWIRGGSLTAATLERIRATLQPQLAADSKDRDGFRQPFAALVLADVVAADNTRAFIAQADLDDLVESASAYLESVRDYRGFDARVGWRHGVAHVADLLAQLAANPRVSKEHLGRIVVAVSTQVVPENGHFYIYGEPARLAAPLFFAAQRGALDAQDWNEWFADLGASPDGESLYASQKGLARRHNVMGMLLALYVNASESDDEALHGVLLEPVTTALRALR